MSSESDQFILEAATSPIDNEALFKSKKWVYSVDSNSSGGQFGQEIQFDLGVIGSQSDYTLLSECKVAVPVFTEVYSNNALFASSIAASWNKDLTILKNGSHHFVHSAALSINGRQIQDFQNYQNISTHADIVTTWSQEELNKMSSTLHMSKTLEDYTNFENEVINTNFTAAGINIANVTSNPSVAERKNTQCNSSGGIPFLIGNATNAGHSLVQVQSSAAVTAGDIVAGQRVYVKSDTIIVRLKDIVPAVKNMPPIKNLRGYLYIKVNAIEAKLTTPAGSNGAIAAMGVVTVTSVNSTAGSSCPVQIINTGTQAAQLFTVASATNTIVAGDWTLRCGPLGANPSTTLTAPKAAHVNARLICPKYECNPAVDAILSMKKTFTVLERRSNRVTLTAGQGNTFNINAGVPNPRYVRVYPYFVGKGSVTTNLPASYNPFMSIVSSEGATTSPLAQLQNFNVYVGNKAVFQDAQMYDYENFCYEVSKLGLSGGQDSMLNSGLINSVSWERFYRYYCCDVSRRLSSEDGNMKSIQVQATNGTNFTLDLLVDTFSERVYTIDTALCEFV
jgi:hypothetical protein